MTDMISDAIAALRLETSTYPALVLIWMKIMAGSFFSGLIIAFWDRRALWIAAMAASTAALLVLVKIAYPDVSRSTAGAIIHLGLWPLCALAVWRPMVADHAVFILWRYWISVLVAVSLVLDLRHLLS